MEAFRVLLELAERIRLELIAMTELETRRDGMGEMFRNDTARVLGAVADALDAAEPPQRAERALATLQASERALLAGGGTSMGLGAHIQALSGQLAAVVRNANWPARAAKSARSVRNPRCRKRCAVRPPFPPCAPTSRPMPWHSAMRFAARWYSPLPSSSRGITPCPMAIGCR